MTAADDGGRLPGWVLTLEEELRQRLWDRLPGAALSLRPSAEQEGDYDVLARHGDAGALTLIPAETVLDDAHLDGLVRMLDKALRDPANRTRARTGDLTNRADTAPLAAE